MLSLLHRFSVQAGDCIFVPGGVPHAIGGGCLMVETQEPSDLMVIPERFTPAGIRLADAKLHGGIGFDKMLNCFCYDGSTAQEARERFFMKPIKVDEHLSIVVDGKDNGIFSVMRVAVDGSYTHAFEESFAIMVVTEGHGELLLGEKQISIKKGDRLLATDLDKSTLQIHGKHLKLVMSLPALEC